MCLCVNVLFSFFSFFCLQASKFAHLLEESLKEMKALLDSRKAKKASPPKAKL